MNTTHTHIARGNGLRPLQITNIITADSVYGMGTTVNTDVSYLGEYRNHLLVCKTAGSGAVTADLVLKILHPYNFSLTSCPLFNLRTMTEGESFAIPIGGDSNIINGIILYAFKIQITNVTGGNFTINNMSIISQG